MLKLRISRKLSVLLGGLIFLSAFTVQAEILFEDDFSSGNLDRYILTWGVRQEKDIVKNAKIIKSDPPEHGPEALSLDEQPHDTNLLAIIKDLEFSDGFIQLLWIDAALPEDADGPIFFRSQMDPKDPNTAFDAAILVELDTDTGLHFDILGGVGVVDDAKDPNTQSTPEWTWIKIMADGGDLKVKSWVAGTDEPKGWTIEFEDKQYDKGVVGFRAWSGTAEIAYIGISDLDGFVPQAVDARGKLSTTWARLKSTF